MNMNQPIIKINPDEVRHLIRSCTGQQAELCAAAQMILDELSFDPILDRPRRALNAMIVAIADYGDRLLNDVDIELSEEAKA